MSKTDTASLFQLPLWFQILSFLFSLLMIIGIAFFLTKLLNIRHEEREGVFGSQVSFDLPIPAKKDPRWERIIELVNSESPSEWKVAVLEADKILEEMVGEIKIEGMRLEGKDMGEKLKKINRSDFLTLDDAWEAHKVRNRIAHEHGFEISQHEARRVVGLFEKVFNEFDFI
ncbi:MAG: hypothetical protein WCW56_03105 [Candidatus Paceibacterota bacterium]